MRRSVLRRKEGAASSRAARMPVVQNLKLRPTPEPKKVEEAGASLQAARMPAVQKLKLKPAPKREPKKEQEVGASLGAEPRWVQLGRSQPQGQEGGLLPVASLEWRYHFVEMNLPKLAKERTTFEVPALQVATAAEGPQVEA